MFFRKAEKKKGHPMLMMTACALAVTGAVCITVTSKNCVKKAANKMTKLFKKAYKSCEEDMMSQSVN